MSRPSIGGALNLAAYEALAQAHRPTGTDALNAEIHRLAGTGLSSRDISAALRVPLDRVMNLLEAPA